MNRSHDRNRREFFRLRLPDQAKLKANICGQTYDVNELSEKSICIVAQEVKSFNGFCSGFIYWSDGQKTAFTGNVGQSTDNGRIILNIKGIDMSEVVSETRRIAARFPLLED